MVLDYYQLREHPFGVTPDPEYLFFSPTHREALAALLYGLEAGCGFVALIAMSGLGKTTLLHCAMNQLRDKARTVFLFQTVCTPMDLLRGLLTGLGVRDIKGSLAEMQLKLKEVLVDQFRLGKRVVVVIDEAQNLKEGELELVRMLSNFETSRDKLIQIVLCGQPQLADKLGSPELVQLRQRISIVAHLTAFSAEETALYIDHRMRAAGYSDEVPLFTHAASAMIAEYSGGIPRNINNLCFNSLSLGCALKRKTIDRDTVREVVADLDLDRLRGKTTTLALPPEPKLLQERPPLLFATNEEPTFGGWVPRIAFAATILLALGGTLFASHRWPVARTAVHTRGLTAPPVTAPPPSRKDSVPRPVARGSGAIHAESVVPALPTTTSSLPAPGLQPDQGQDQLHVQGQEPSTAGTAVRVTPGKTLLGICVENFGKCDAGLLQEIHKLNPQLSNLDHIEPGQSIRIPALPKVLEQGTEEQPAQASLAEKGMQ